ncbi:cytochrome c-type biogenesis CcmF C-terminal domain-containing protein [uncultured Meiothermus sp.]|jgi:cytochrome c-type biogenesis protein CcmF|uniref:heme lyase CcmF/NrfE family subunit n=1 Tax=uncultured Meiothermus sp. TaxID=157471 RepID=UPI002636D839|nr:cytochrome c-type biogenesis CcmF C-terminal domain-containing protein [uncultured Meiothermus sp.]
MTPGLLGGIALVAALIFSVIGLVVILLAHFLKDRRYVDSAKRISTLALLAGLVSYGSLTWAILINDFSVSYVAQSSSIENPLWVKLVTPWAALEGSILLWALIQTAYTWLVSLRVGKSLDTWRAPVALGTLFAIQVFFFALIVFVANPFGVVPNPPPDGQGTNPLLQNHWMMAVHPVFMYLGFVGLSVPFAYAMAAMVSKQYQGWIFETRWWTLVAWGFLTAGIYTGKWWSYEILGWGGYWAWDPVENASLIPWLFATAFLHTGQVQERNGLFKSWNFGFITLAFAATVFGTFLTRSGVIMSVHAFASGPVGAWFLVFLLSVLALGLGMLSRVSSEIKDAGEVKWKSREGALLGGALLFGTFAFVVVLGTIWPLVVEAFSGAEVSIGAPFFNQVSIPLGILMLLLMGIGPILPWRNTGAQVKRNITIMLVALGIGTLFGQVLGLTIGVSLTMGLFAYNLAAIWLMVSQGVRERSSSLGIPAGQALWELASSHRRRFGSHIVHFGIALAALTIAFSQTYRVTEQRTLNIGETWQTQGMEIRLLSVTAREEANRFAALAPIEVRSISREGWGSDGVYQTRLNFYPQMDAPLATPVVKYSLYNDFYFVLMQFDQERGQWATLKIIVTPLVLWLWVAGFIIAFGTIYILWPGAARVSRHQMTPTVGD